MLYYKICIQNKRETAYLIDKMCVENEWDGGGGGGGGGGVEGRGWGCFLVYSSLISIVRPMFCHEKCA